MNNTTAISESKQRSLANLKPFVKGVSGNPAGRPVGSVSPIGEIKKIFEESPEKLKEFINAYLRDPHNRQHIVEMIDGKPKGSSAEVNIGDNRKVIYSPEIIEEEAIEFLKQRGWVIRKESNGQIK